VTITSSKADFSDAVFEMTAETKSIDTKLEQRDEDLRSADFFDTEKFPLIQFKSTEIKKIVKNKYQLKGNLSMHGVTKQITADFIFKGTRADPVTKKLTAGIQVISILKRTDFNIGWKMPFEDLKNDVLITADGEFQQQ
jgi:polyisoprenoid-binding protein YceI